MKKKKKPKQSKKTKTLKKTNKVLFGGVGVCLVLAVAIFGKESFLPTAKAEQEKNTINPHIVKLKSGNEHIKNYFQKYCKEQTVLDLEGKSLAQASVLIEGDITPKYTDKLVENFLNTCVLGIKAIEWGNPQIGAKYYDTVSPFEQLHFIGKYIVESLRIKYEEDRKNAEANLISVGIVDMAQGKQPLLNCATLPVLFTMISEKLGLPVKLVTIKNHVFCRYEKGTERYNIEIASKLGTFYIGKESDQDLIDEFKVHKTTVDRGVYMRSLPLSESYGLLFANKAQYYDAKKKSEKAMTNKAYAFLFNERDFFVIRDIRFMLHDFYSEEEGSLDLHNALVDHLRERLGYKTEYATINKETKKRKERQRIEELRQRATQQVQSRPKLNNKINIPKIPSPYNREVKQ